MIDFLQQSGISFHNVNIIVHISIGSVAIILAVTQLLNKKGGKRHRQVGRLFLICFSLVIFTAALGAFLFNFRPFLTILTFTSAYSCWSGYRVLKIKGRKPTYIDNGVSIFCIVACVIFIMAANNFQINRPMVTINATITTLILMCLFDLSRNLMTIEWRQYLWLKEHIYKMMSALGALLSAASGNLLQSYGAWSQLSPNIICFIIIVYFFLTDKTLNRKKLNLQS